MFRKALLFCALALLSLPASATLCTLAVIGTTCTFASDNTGGDAIFRNPLNLSNIGSGVIDPFLGTQVGGNGGVEFGVNTDQAAVNLLPLDDKRDNANTFTTTFTQNQMGTVVIGGVEFYDFFLDINEPNGGDARFLSIDTLRIFGRTGPNAADPIDLNKNNILSLADLDVFPNLSLAYAFGPNTLILDYNLFAGSGLGYDLEFLVPVSAFSNIALDSRIVFSVGYGGADAVVSGSLAQDGFEEWAVLKGNGPHIPEPMPLALLGIGLLSLGAVRRYSR